ncbi:alpha/beta hydrolase [Bacteroidota bacterium]
MIILYGLGIILSLFVVYLIFIIFFPGLEVRKQPIKLSHDDKDAPTYRQDVTFDVDGSSLRGWLYLPEDIIKPVPCIVMSHGFCGTKDMLLEQYALKFVEEGIATLTFDYRHFGDSEGEPRQHYSTNNQLADIKAAVNYSRSRGEIDPDKIVIWGTSSSGNYGIPIAAEDKNIAAVIGQCPSLDHQLDGKMNFQRDGLGWMLKLIMHAQRDKGRSRFGLSPHTFPAVGQPGTTAMLIAPEAFEGYQEIAKDSKTFRNEVCARLMLGAHGPNLFTSAEKVSCPLLFLICENDNIVHPDSYKKIEKILEEKVKILKYPIGHFDIYVGEHFEKCINDQIAFLKEILENDGKI